MPGFCLRHLFRFVFRLCLFLAPIIYATAAKAGDIGIHVLPRDMDNLTLDNYIEALDLGAEAGANVFFNGPRWSEMEAKSGVYTLDAPLGGARYALERGKLKGTYFGLQLINTVKRELPPDLEHKAWDDPVMTERLDKLAAEIQKFFGKSPPLAISVGNEVDIYFEKYPDELDSYLLFLKRAKAVFEKHFPGTPVGTTVTFDGLMKGRKPYIEKLIRGSDVVFFTYYPVIDLKPLPLADINEHLETMTSLAGSRRFVLQEVGYPASPDLGLSEDIQNDFYKAIIPLLMRSKKIEASFIFALHDLPPGLCNSLMGYYGAIGWPSDLRSKFQSFLCTLGLRQSDGTPRKAYETVKSLLID